MARIRKFTDQQFIELYNKNLNDRQIAEILNVSRERIRNKRWELKLLPKLIQIHSNPTINLQNLIEANIKDREKNKPRIKTKNTSYYLKNKQKIALSHKREEYRQSHNKSERKYNKTHKNQISTYQKKRRNYERKKKE